MAIEATTVPHRLSHHDPQRDRQNQSEHARAGKHNQCKPHNKSLPHEWRGTRSCQNARFFKSQLHITTVPTIRTPNLTMFQTMNATTVEFPIPIPIEAKKKDIDAPSTACVAQWAPMHTHHSDHFHLFAFFLIQGRSLVCGPSLTWRPHAACSLRPFFDGRPHPSSSLRSALRTCWKA